MVYISIEITLLIDSVQISKIDEVKYNLKHHPIERCDKPLRTTQLGKAINYARLLDGCTAIGQSAVPSFAWCRKRGKARCIVIQYSRW